MNTTVKFKICCIKDENEARKAVNAGAYAIGLVSEMPSGPGVISEDKTAQIVKTVPEHVKTFLLTSRTSAAEIIKQQKRTGVNTIQLVDSVEVNEYNILRRELHGISLVQVIHVLDEDSVTEAKEAAESVDFILLDSGNPNLEIKQLGGTGRTHNWELSRKIVEQAGVPVFLAGGLNPQNAAEAVRIVKPFGVDICSGVRTDGSLDEVKLNKFAEELKNLPGL